MPDNPDAICGSCGGTRTCPYCYRGKVDRTDYRTQRTIYADCVMCSGTSECSACGGSGERPEADEARAG